MENIELTIKISAYVFLSRDLCENCWIYVPICDEDWNITRKIVFASVNGFCFYVCPLS